MRFADMENGSFWGAARIAAVDFLCVLRVGTHCHRF